MTLIEELKIFVKTILHWIYSFIGFSLFFFIFGLKKVIFFGKNLFLPIPSEDSFSVQVFNRIRIDLLPKDVQLIVTNPMSAFLTQLLLAILLGFLFTFPLFLYRLIIYLQPALRPHEKRALMWSLLPLVFLFILGSIFSYLFLIPATFDILYPYATSMGIVPFFSLDEFIYYVLLLIVASGIMFLLPIFMVLLSFIGIIKAEFWINHWKGSLLFFLIVCAIITPDQTGITMVMLFLPLALLYFIGYYFANKLSRSNY
ncbi:MAG: twin-arginine translocase subunit TatC [Candidatus Zambryskibacteria bacterium]|nr:twin-arginine translocase subunit TatC [Candidatus Zambryskibacteria bacterium]